MSKLIPFSTIGGPRVWISPDHVTMVSPAGPGRSKVEMLSEEVQFIAAGGADQVAEEINRHRSEP